ncbi:MAG: hypothetical protein AUK48_02095 [Oscillatoriales cyanobacterium CG2_30_44_21]|nr:MAG: hypothetical protein AUK48_02095 [Oscillatoriales cyanobacterium CG2_30_44_21]
MILNNIFLDKPNDKHRQEWLDSAVSELLIDANLHTITDHRTINYLLGWKTPKGAAGKQTKEDRTCWAVWGTNPLNPSINYFGVQIKPDKPRSNAEGKAIKYESVMGKKEASQPLFLKVPDPIWEQIATKWAVPILPEEYAQGFWQWVLDNPRLPILITEGAKKAASLLTHGYAAISIAGVTNGQYLGELNPYIAPFCPLSRRVYLAYDADLHSKPNVRKELDRLGRLIAASGSIPNVMLWEEDKAKGIDDYISEFGAEELDKIYSNSLTFEAYRRQEKDREKNEPEEIETEQHFNQIAIATIYKNQRYICLNDVLHLWTGTHYEPSTDAIEKRRITRFCNAYKYYDARLRKYTFRHANDQSVNGVLKWLKNSCGVDIADVNPSGLNLLNGVLTITWNGRSPIYTLKKHCPDIIYTHVSKVKYDPSADPFHCEKLLSILEPAQQKILLKVLASTLDTPAVRAKVAGRSIRCLLLKGTGNNGKDTLRECVEQIFGASTTSCSLSDFRDYDQGRKFNLAPLANSKINWSPENTDSLLLDKLEVMKAIVTGDPLWIEAKNQAAYSIKPQFAMIFNVNKMPALSGAQEAIKSRYAILSFDKTIVEKPDPNNPNEIQGDQRYKYDSEFQQQVLCPSLLNRLLEALTELMSEGIDYSSCDAAILAAREDSCHLLKWAKEIGLEYGNGRIRLGDLFNNLKQWYVDNGILEIEESSTGKERLQWLDEGDKYDPFVKAPRLMRTAIAKLFPNAKFSEKTEYGFFAVGIQSLQFADLPNFGSFGSVEEEKEETAIVLQPEPSPEPNPEPNNFASGLDFGSGNKTTLLIEIIRSLALAYRAENSYPVENLFSAIRLIENGKITEANTLIAPDLKEFMRHSESSQKQSFAVSQLFALLLAEPTEPNNFAPEPNKPDNHAISAPTEPNYAKTNYSVNNNQQQPLKIGDRVDVFKYKSLCEKFHKIRNLPHSGYVVRKLSLDNGVTMATIKHPQMKASLVVEADWLMHALEVSA